MAMSAGADELQDRAASRVGEVLRGKWRLDGLLGVGGTACVYAATHRNGKRGAVKLLRPELSANEEAKRRFLREGYVANRIEHPGAVVVLDDDVAEDGSVFLVMELLEGQTLEDFARARPSMRLSPSETALITDKLLDVLVAAHDKTVIHRDLKPENVFLTMTGDVKILDFGTARMLEGPSAGRMTEAGHIMGTPAFMPPEQAMGHSNEIDGRTDLWAVGAIMFYVLTGQVVHNGETLNTVLLSAMTKQAPPLQSLVPDIPAELCAIVDRALAFEKDKRWPDARAMQRALRTVRQSLPTTPSLAPARFIASNIRQGGPTANLALTQDATQPPARKNVRVALVFGGLFGVALATAIIVFVSTTPAPSASTETATASPALSAASTPSAIAALPAPTTTPVEAASAAPVPDTGTTGQTKAVTAPKTTTKTTPATKTKTTPKTGGSKDIFSQW